MNFENYASIFLKNMNDLSPEMVKVFVMGMAFAGMLASIDEQNKPVQAEEECEGLCVVDGMVYYRDENGILHTSDALREISNGDEAFAAMWLFSEGAI